MRITRILNISADHIDPQSIQEAAAVLRSGGLVAFPTETVYGLGADAMNPDAVNKVFLAKGRPSDNPLIVHISDLEDVHKFAKNIPPKGKELADQFWPGPLTLIVPRLNTVPNVVTAGLETVALRIPNHPVARAMIRAFGSGVVAPSANLSGFPSPTIASHVQHDLHGSVDVILDGGPTQIGIESTVVDVTVTPPVILRHGGLSQEEIEKVVGALQATNQLEFLRRSPGTRYRHYAPKATLEVIEHGNQEMFAMVVERYRQENKTIGLISYSLSDPQTSRTHHPRRLSSDPSVFARDFFRVMRELDELQVDVIVVEAPPEEGIGVALLERLKKAVG